MCAWDTSTTSPSASSGRTRASTASARAPTSSTVSPGCAASPGITPSRHRYQPGCCALIWAVVMPS